MGSDNRSRFFAADKRTETGLSVEVARWRFKRKCLGREFEKPLDHDVYDLVLSLNDAFGDQHVFFARDAPPAVPDARADDEIGLAGFVFQRHKDDAGGSAGALAMRDE